MDVSSSCVSSRAQSILDFAKYLQHELEKRVEDIPTLATHLEALASSPLHDATQEERSLLHQTGVELWNKCRLDDNDESKKRKSLLAQGNVVEVFDHLARTDPRPVKAFAYFIFKKPVESTAIRAAKACINTEQLSLASSILERISQSSGREYSLLRILLACKEDKPSIADLFFAKLGKINANDGGEHAISLFLEIGVEYLDQGLYEEARKWLNRAYTTVQQCDWRLMLDGPELRLNVLHAYTRSLFASNEHHDLAREILTALQDGYPNKLAVLVLRIEHYADVEDLRTTLEKIVQSMQLLKSNIQLVMHYVHILRHMNLEYACKVLQSLILKRLIPEGSSHWIELSILTLVWMITQGSGTQSTPEVLNDVLKILHDAGKTAVLSPDSSQGAIVLVWKRIEQACEIEAQLAVRWCKTALVLAHQTGTTRNQYAGKLTRKLVTCCIADKDYQGAQDALEKLPEDAKDHHLSRYLAYVVAMRHHDDSMAERALASLAAAPKDGDKLLFACVSETDKYGSPMLQAKLLQRILDKYSNVSHPDVNISALLRATARLLWQLLEEDTDNVDEEILERLCTVFQAAKTRSIRCNGDRAVTSQHYSAVECEWFSKNGYNLALRMLQQWPVSCTLRILEDIAHLKYPESLSTDVLERNTRRNKKIAYVRTILYTRKARDGDLASYTKVMTVYNNSIVNAESEQLFLPLLPLIFEAALYSKVPDLQNKLNHLLAILTPNSSKPYAACAEMVLAGAMASDETRLSIDVAVALLSRILLKVRTLEGYDIKQASRWIRCVIQLIIDTSATRGGGAAAASGLGILKAAFDEAAQVVQDIAYPGEELEWLATTAFNLAIDLYVAEDDNEGKGMALRALTFADAMADEGFAVVLKEKLRKIGWW